jgi:hypothetical protein
MDCQMKIKCKGRHHIQDQPVVSGRRGDEKGLSTTNIAKKFILHSDIFIVCYCGSRTSLRISSFQPWPRKLTNASKAQR